MKLLAVIGTRPEAIKMCPLIRELQKREGFTAEICATGQHGELFDTAMRPFSLHPIENFGLMPLVHSQEELMIGILSRLPAVLKREAPSCLLVHGDTTTALSAALCGFFEGIPVAHVEAGLRTYQPTPFPEEFNRRAIALTASFHFAPTEKAKENLLREGVPCETVFVTGNTGLDSLSYTIDANWISPFAKLTEGKRLVLVTAHRRENLERLSEMMEAIAMVAEAHTDLAILVPAHPNPPVRAAMRQAFAKSKNINVIPPLGVLDFHNLMARCFCTLTDSGGIQEEAAALHIPTLVMREETERPEGVASGALITVGCTKKSITEGFLRLLNDKKLYQNMKQAQNPYGDGKASVRIADILCRYLPK